MKLVYLSTARVPDDWAHVHHIMHMCEAFAHTGAEVKLVVPRRGPTPTGGTQDPFKYSGVEENFTIVRLPCLDIFPGTTSAWLFYIRNITFFISARLYLWVNKYNALYTREPWAAYFFRQFFFEAHTAQGSSSLLSHTHSMVVLTEFLKDIFVKRGFPAKNILVEPDAVDLKRFAHLLTRSEARKKCHLPENFKLIGYVGALKTMDRDKGILTALESLKNLGQDTRLVVVGGEVKDVEEYKNVAKKMGVSERAIFTSKVPHESVPEYLEAFDVVIAPFPDIEHYRLYMSPLKIFEYMASGVPMVVSDLPSLRGVLSEKTARFVPASDAKALASTITDLLTHPDVADELGQTAKREVERYTWDKRAERILSFVGNVVR